MLIVATNYYPRIAGVILIDEALPLVWVVPGAATHLHNDTFRWLPVPRGYPHGGCARASVQTLGLARNPPAVA